MAGPAVGYAAAAVLLYPPEWGHRGLGRVPKLRVCSERTVFTPVGLLSYWRRKSPSLAKQAQSPFVVDLESVSDIASLLGWTVTLYGCRRRVAQWPPR